MRVSVRSIALAFVLPLTLLALLAVPAASADGGTAGALECRSTTVGVGVIILAEVEYGECGIAVVPYTCDVEWYGGRGLLGGFVFTCTPDLREPCVFPVCRP